jgi:hypothetical protein
VIKAPLHPNIENADGLVRELGGNNANPSQVLDQAGEALSARDYANTGYEVTVEPGAVDYDMGTRLAHLFSNTQHTRSANLRGVIYYQVVTG